MDKASSTTPLAWSSARSGRLIKRIETGSAKWQLFKRRTLENSTKQGKRDLTDKKSLTDNTNLRLKGKSGIKVIIMMVLRGRDPLLLIGPGHRQQALSTRELNKETLFLSKMINLSIVARSFQTLSLWREITVKLVLSKTLIQMFNR